MIKYHSVIIGYYHTVLVTYALENGVPARPPVRPRGGSGERQPPRNILVCRLDISVSSREGMDVDSRTKVGWGRVRESST